MLKRSFSMAKRTTIEVFRAFENGRLRQIGLSAEQVRRLCPESGSGWTIERSVESVGEAQGIVIAWCKHGGCCGEHVHWQCALCGEEHISDFNPHADSNPVLWFCERGNLDEMCLVYWRFEKDDLTRHPSVKEWFDSLGLQKESAVEEG
jgi:hypothetical protein